MNKTCLMPHRAHHWRSCSAAPSQPVAAAWCNARRPVSIVAAHAGGRSIARRDGCGEGEGPVSAAATASLAVGSVQMSPPRPSSAEALRSVDNAGPEQQPHTSGQTPSSARERAPPQKLVKADDAWAAFEARLEADLQTVGTTLVAIVGVIVFWRGVWSLLDYYLGDNPIGDVCCVLAGLGIIMYIRLSGLKMGSFWPSG